MNHAGRNIRNCSRTVPRGICHPKCAMLHPRILVLLVVPKVHLGLYTAILTLLKSKTATQIAICLEKYLFCKPFSDIHLKFLNIFIFSPPTTKTNSASPLFLNLFPQQHKTSFQPTVLGDCSHQGKNHWMDKSRPAKWDGKRRQWHLQRKKPFASREMVGQFLAGFLNHTVAGILKHFELVLFCYSKLYHLSNFLGWVGPGNVEGTRSTKLIGSFVPKKNQPPWLRPKNLYQRIFQDWALHCFCPRSRHNNCSTI